MGWGRCGSGSPASPPPVWRPVTLLGRSGATGSCLFHCPGLDVCLTGTVDEMKAGAFPYRLLPKVLRTVAR